MQQALDRVRAGEADPPCRDCGGILKSATISFGQALVPEVIDGALRAAEEAARLATLRTAAEGGISGSRMPSLPGICGLG